jgi:hypothetical protein
MERVDEEATLGQGDLRAAAAAKIRDNSPYARCFECLAIQLVVTEAMVREVAQLLIGRDGFALDRRVCYACNRVHELVVPVEDIR